jgi:tRNA uridine 5-carboxymethylaminomethyl modification enzyme
MQKVQQKRDGVEKIKRILKEISVEPEEISGLLDARSSAPLTQKQKAHQILLRPNLDIFSMMKQVPKIETALSEFNKDTLEQAEIQIKYDVYIEKENELVQKMSQLEDLVIPSNFDYAKLVSLSNEARQKFNKIRPHTLGQASRISGVNPSDVQILMVYMGR